MESITLVLATLLTVVAVGLLLRAWRYVGQLDTELRELSGFQGMHFEDCSPATRAGDGAQ